MITRYCFAFALGVSLEACFGGDIPSTDRLLSRSEVYEIAEHVRELPPYRCDVTVIVEFALRPIPESDLRRSVEKMYREMDTEQGKLTSPTQFSEEVSKEVERLLQEQLLPRRIKERLRREGQRYRIDEVRTQTGLEAIDASTAWQRSFINLCDGASSPRDSAKRDWNQKILSIFGSRHGTLKPQETLGREGQLVLGRPSYLNNA